MASMLVELGRDPRSDVRLERGGFSNLYRFVRTFEKPTAGMKLPAPPSPAQQHVLTQMAKVSAQMRRGLAEGRSIPLPDPALHRPMALRMGFDFSAIIGAIGSVATKVIDVASQPGFLTSVISAANFIPKIGPEVSALISPLAAFDPATAKATTQAAGEAGAASTAFALPGNIIESLPSFLQGPATSIMQSLIPDAKEGGTDLLSTLLKGIGSFVATQQLAGSDGIGTAGIPGDVMAQIAGYISQDGGADIQNAIRAGQQDLLNAAALTGNTAAVQSAFDQWGKSDNTLLYVAGGVAGVGLITTVIILGTRR